MSVGTVRASPDGSVDSWVEYGGLLGRRAMVCRADVLGRAPITSGGETHETPRSRSEESTRVRTGNDRCESVEEQT